jgi:hypothetical protein
LISSEGIKYILLTPRYYSLSEYFASSCCFDEVERIGDNEGGNIVYRIYRVSKVGISTRSSLPIVGPVLRRSMAILRQKAPATYEHFKKKYIQELALLTPGEATRIFDSVE